MNLLRIATRQSPLALWQAEHVAGLLTTAHPGLRVELVKMVTEGDRILDRALNTAGGKGLFIKELEQGLAEGRADLAVHSMKDVPADLPPGFDLPVFCAAADPRDALVSGTAGSIDALPVGARIGTASLRRGCQLLARRPDLRLWCAWARRRKFTSASGCCTARRRSRSGAWRRSRAGREPVRATPRRPFATPSAPRTTSGASCFACSPGR